jgi:hypothetical protein
VASSTASTRADDSSTGKNPEPAGRRDDWQLPRVLNDRGVPGTRGNIHHIVIAPADVFVVDAKHLTVRIELRDKGGLFRP